MRQLIAGNWKMNATTREAAALVGALAAADAPALACDVLVCPPATQLMMAAHALLGTSIAVGAQDCHAEGCGAHTGDVAASMLRDAGATWVIVGHSERRAEHGESDDVVRAKAAAAARAGLTPIVCVGETQAQRAGGHQTDIIGRQLAGSLPDGFGDEFGGVVAYEPIWAIGTGQSATEADVEAMHAFIRAQLVQRFPAMGGGMRVLYGGSVKPSNAASLLALPDVGGALVGGASLVAADFLAIARAARAI